MISKTAKAINKWFPFPDLLENKRFGGYFTRDDITQIMGFFPIGQNIVFTDSNTPTARNGSEVVGSESTSITPVNRAWVFETREGVQIEMRTHSTKVEFRIEGLMDDFQLLQDGFTTGLEFAYAVISQSGLTTSYLQFCNGIEDIHRWTGVYGTYASDNGADQITLSGSVSLAILQFTATGTIIINDVAITYTGISGQTFTGCSSVPIGPVVGEVVVQGAITTGFTATVKYSVGFAMDGRVHARNEDKKSVSFYSKLDDPFNWTTGDLDGDGGGKEIEQGGPITAYAKFGEKTLIFKKKLIKTLEFLSNTDRVDVPKYTTLKPSDDKSTTIGAIGQKSTFHGPNGIYFVTEDKELLELNFNQNITYPELLSISDSIRPTFQKGVHDTASGIVFDSKVWYAYKQDENSTYNDTVIVFDLIRKIWYLPIVGWNVADWTIISNTLHWHSSTGPVSYKMINDKTDNSLGFTTILRTWSEDFSLPLEQKKAGYCYLEIYMPENTVVSATILYDEGGVSGSEEYTLDAKKDTKNVFSAEVYNPFGALPFGQERFGSNPDLTGMKKYRYILELKKNTLFYNIALQLSTDEAGYNYEMIRFAWFVNEYYPLEQLKLLKKVT